MFDRASASLRVYVFRQEQLEGSLDFTRLPKSICQITSHENRFSGTIDLGNLPKSMTFVNFRNNALNGTVRVPHGLRAILEGNDDLTVERIEE